MVSHPNLPDREIYPNDSLQLVAFELRMPYVPNFAGQEAAAAALYARLRDTLPIIGPAPVAAVQIQAGEGGVSTREAPIPLRLLNRTRTLSVTISPTALIVETSDYGRIEVFEAVIHELLEAAGPDVAGIERVGLRYINEIRVPGVTTVNDWRGYINPTLLAGLDIDSNFSAEAIHGMIQYGFGGDRHVNMRFGALPEGGIVNPAGPLRFKPSDGGPYFLIDLDSFWTTPDDEMPEFTVDRAMDICLSLRPPLHTLFEAAITDRLREEVLRQEDE
jgi:uncharacterized protein (TIGR04255 family)